jgi:hypothetical protein
MFNSVDVCRLELLRRAETLCIMKKMMTPACFDACLLKTHVEFLRRMFADAALTRRIWRVVNRSRVAVTRKFPPDCDRYNAPIGSHFTLLTLDSLQCCASTCRAGNS